MAYLQEVGQKVSLRLLLAHGPFKFESAQPGYTEVVVKSLTITMAAADDLRTGWSGLRDTVVFRVIPEASIAWRHCWLVKWI
jgi:hypothetical protein